MGVNKRVEHTPGPWHIGQGNGEGCVFSNSGRMKLGQGGSTLYPICTVPEFSDEDSANARLIAAAPDLLDACRKAMNMVIDGAHDELVLGVLCHAIRKAAGTSA